MTRRASVCSLRRLLCWRVTRGQRLPTRRWMRSNTPQGPAPVPELSILIVSYNTEADLVRCLDSLISAPPRVSHEIVVVDNGSRDGSVKAVQSRSPRARVIALDTNRGFAGATNVGFRQS